MLFPHRLSKLDGAAPMTPKMVPATSIKMDRESTVPLGSHSEITVILKTSKVMSEQQLQADLVPCLNSTPRQITSIKNIGSTPEKKEKVWNSLFSKNKFFTRGMDLGYVVSI